MNLFERLHGGYIQQRRVRRLVDLLVEIIPPNGEILDVGCGDGHLAAVLGKRRPDLSVKGLDVLIRQDTWISVRAFDGITIPHRTRTVDMVLLIDVLHHVQEPLHLLREALRVAKKAVIVKDHLSDGWLAGPTLRFMDFIGNSRYGVAIPGNYWGLSQWESTFKALAVKPVEWRQKLHLYPGPLDALFGRNLHFLAKLEAA